MKAILAEQYGEPEVLQMADDLPTPRVGPNGVLVQVHATSVNPVDWKYRQGLLAPVRPVVFPVIWGCDLSGVVTEVGPELTLFKPGDEAEQAEPSGSRLRSFGGIDGMAGAAEPGKTQARTSSAHPCRSGRRRG